MRKLILPALAIALAAAASAHAQPPRGGGGPGSSPPPGGGGPPSTGQIALNKIVLTGVVLAVDPAADRVTIAYDPCEALGWPAGSMPFSMARSGLLGDIQLRQKVRFRLENHRIAEFLPEGPPNAEAGGPPPAGSGGQPPGPPPR